MSDNKTNLTVATESNSKVSSDNTTSYTKGQLTLTEDTIYLGLGDSKRLQYNSSKVEDNTRYIQLEDGQPVCGSLGFGCGVAPESYVTKFKLTPMSEYNNPASENYGNYIDSTGSVLCYIPLYFVKKTYHTDNNPSVTRRINVNSYQLNRNFPNGRKDIFNPPFWGQAIEMSRIKKEGFNAPLWSTNLGTDEAMEGIFIDKYPNSASPRRIPISIRYGIPLSCHYGYNSIANNIMNCSEHKLLEFYKAVKQRGNNYSLPHISLYIYLQEMAIAHLQSLWWKYKGFDNIPEILCSYAKVPNYHFICGNTRDGVNLCRFKKEIVFKPNPLNSIFSLAGSCDDKYFSYICHTGQKCGVVDLIGNGNELTSGNLGVDFNTLKYLNPAVDLSSITKYNVLDRNLYVEVNLPSYLPKKYISFSSSDWYSFSTGVTDFNKYSDNWIFNEFGFKTTNNTKDLTSDKNRFQCYFKQNSNSNCILFGGTVGTSNNVELESIRLRDNLNASFSDCYFRSCLIP